MNHGQADFEIIRPHGETVALVEVKNVPQLTPGFAAELRRNLLESDVCGEMSAYFVLVSQDDAFLWKPEQAKLGEVEPAAVIPMRQVLSLYLSEDVLNQHLHGSALEIVVLQWLHDLSNGQATIPTDSVIVAEFVKQLRGGEVLVGERS